MTIGVATQNYLSKEIVMLKKLAFTTFLAAIAALALPALACAYGAAHASATHVGAGGVSHTSATAVRGPGYAGGHSTTVGAGGGVHYGYQTSASGATSSGVRYVPSYSPPPAGGAVYGGAGGARYGYVR
jgi:hypothetical protein